MQKKKDKAAIVIGIWLVIVGIVAAIAFLWGKDGYNGVKLTGFQVLARVWPSFWWWVVGGFIMGNVAAYLAWANYTGSGSLGEKFDGNMGYTILFAVIALVCYAGPWGVACGYKANGGFTLPKQESSTLIIRHMTNDDAVVYADSLIVAEDSAIRIGGIHRLPTATANLRTSVGCNHVYVAVEPKKITIPEGVVHIGYSGKELVCLYCRNRTAQELIVTANRNLSYMPKPWQHSKMSYYVEDTLIEGCKQTGGIGYLYPPDSAYRPVSNKWLGFPATMNDTTLQK